MLLRENEKGNKENRIDKAGQRCDFRGSPTFCVIPTESSGAYTNSEFVILSGKEAGLSHYPISQSLDKGLGWDINSQVLPAVCRQCFGGRPR